MAFFNKTSTYLGVDIGTSAIKLIELDDYNGKPRLKTYGAFENPFDITKIRDEAELRKISQYISFLVKKTGVTSKSAVSALPSFTVFSQILSMPKVGKNEITEAIRTEAKKLIPKPLDEMVLDWKVLDSNLSVPHDENVFSLKQEIKKEKKKKKGKKEKKQERILITATDKQLVNKFISLFQHAGLQLVSLETESFALIRALMGKDTSNVMIVDMGASTMDITLVEELIPVLSRSINLGGFSITDKISKITGSSIEDAEQIKKDFEYHKNSHGIPESLNDTLEPVMNEIKYTLDLYRNRTGNLVEKVILTGGSAQFYGLADFFSENLNIRVFVGNPWTQIMYPSQMKSLLQDVGSRYTVAVGLALRNFKFK